MYISKSVINVLLLAIVLVSLVGYNFMSAQTNWTTPTGTPPANNVMAPINIGTSTQSTQQANGTVIFNRLVGENAVWSDQYCDAVGAHCFTATSTGGGGGGISQLLGGAGITLSPTTITGTGTININQTYTQRRITGTCPVGQAINSINADGTVLCQATAGVGVNQTWQNVTASRAVNIWYQNTTGKPISVYVWVEPGDGALYANTVGADAGAVQIAGPDNDSGTRDNLFGIIPSGHWYRTGGRTPRTWSELR